MLCREQHKWNLSVSVCVHACVCVHICVCVCEL